MAGVGFGPLRSRGPRLNDHVSPAVLGCVEGVVNVFVGGLVVRTVPHGYDALADGQMADCRKDVVVNHVAEKMGINHRYVFINAGQHDEEFFAAPTSDMSPGISPYGGGQNFRDLLQRRVADVVAMGNDPDRP